MKSKKMTRSRAIQILEILEADYPNAESEINHESTFQLLVGTMLSAQATDRKVNEVTKELFSQYKTPNDFLTLSQEDLERRIRQIHFCRVKARNILAMCRTLMEEFGGEVPRTREDLMKLAGVGRKTANVILSYAYGIPAIAVDTHVHRVASRLGMVSEKDALKTELAMEKLIPKAWWLRSHSSMVLHGRRVCTARSPKCHLCSVSRYCNTNNRNCE